MRKKICVLFLLAALCFPVFCFSQSTELSLTVGGVKSYSQGNAGCEAIIVCQIPSSIFHIDTGFALNANFAHRLVGFKVVSLDLELPLMESPSRGTSSVFSSLNTVISPGDISTLFFTPSLRLKIAPGAPISPFFSIGGGLAHYNVNSTSTNKGAVQVGAGADFKTPIPLLALRAEFRDFASGQPSFGAGTSADNNPRHNLYFGGGLVLRF